jgi:hypothetical protein
MLLESAYHHSMAVKVEIKPQPAPHVYEANPAAQKNPMLAHNFPFAFVQGHVLRTFNLDRATYSPSRGPLQVQTKFGARRHSRFGFYHFRRHAPASPKFSSMCIAGKFDATNPKPSDTMEDINMMSSAELKSELLEMGISITDCFEKSDLKTRLQEARSRVTSKINLRGQMLRAGGVKTRLVRLRADEGSLGDNIQIDDKCYYAITLHFSDSGGSLADSFFTCILLALFECLTAVSASS